MIGLDAEIKWTEIGLYCIEMDLGFFEQLNHRFPVILT